MKLTYYAQSDILLIEFNKEAIGEAQALGRWANATFSLDGTLQSVEILNAAARGIHTETVTLQIVSDESAPTPELSAEAVSAGRKARAQAIRVARNAERVSSH